MTRYAIGVDVGGSSTKAGIYSLEGLLVGSGSRAYGPHQPAPGIAEYDPDELTAAVEDSIRTALTSSGVDPRHVVAICCDAMISGTVGLGADGRPTTPYTTTLDTRFAPHLQRMLAHEDQIRPLVGSGAPVVAAKIAWYRDAFPEVFERTDVFVLAGGLIGAHLAELAADEAVIDPTVLWAVGLSDTREGRWSHELTTLLDIPDAVLPRIVPSTSVIGGVGAGVAQRTGLLRGTPVVAGCGDQMAGFLGADALRDGVIGDSSGTYEVVGRFVEEFRPDPAGRFDVIPHPTRSGFANQAVVAIGGGFTTNWFATTVLGLRGGDFAAADALAAAAPVGSDGLLFLPHLGGQGAPSRPGVRGGWLGLSWGHGREHLTRSVMEAIAFEIAEAVDSFGGAGVDDVVIGYGGGARSAVAAQLRADVAGLPYRSLGEAVPTTAAAALLGALGTGELDDLAVGARAALPAAVQFRPNPENHRRYAVARDRYREALAAAVTLAAGPA